MKGASTTRNQKNGYAVVVFINDSSNEMETASEIPAIWLTEDKKSCWWPNVRHVGPYIVKQTEPDKTKWGLHQIRFIGFYDDIISARHKADGFSSCDDEPNICTKNQSKMNALPSITEEKLKTQRFTKKSHEKEKEMYSASDESDEGERFSNKKVPSPPSITSITSSQYVPVKNDSDQKPIHIQKNTPKVRRIEPFDLNMNMSKALAAAPNNGGTSEIAPKIMELINDDRFSLPTDASMKAYLLENEEVSISGQIQDLKDDISQFQEKMITKLGDIFFELTQLRERFNRIEEAVNVNQLPMSNSVDNSDLLKILPLPNVEQIQEFETFLTVEDIKSRLISLLVQVGGRNAKECICRMLSKIIAPTAAKYCSWCGQRGNFKVSNLEIIAYVKEAVKKSHTCTDKYFEDESKEWFRQGTQKFARMQKTATIAAPT